jgi:histidyl-tRNA synthetase
MRREGIGTILASGNRSLKAQLRHANALGATSAIIIGEDELRNGMIVWRDMTRSEQQRLSFEDALSLVKSRESRVKSLELGGGA